MFFKIPIIPTRLDLPWIALSMLNWTLPGFLETPSKSFRETLIPKLIPCKMKVIHWGQGSSILHPHFPYLDHSKKFSYLDIGSYYWPLTTTTSCSQVTIKRRKSKGGNNSSGLLCFLSGQTSIPALSNTLSLNTEKIKIKKCNGTGEE